jgi:hypothetical protein
VACILYGVGAGLRSDIGIYTVIWMIDVVLCIFASVMSFRIKVDLWGRQRKKQHDSSKKKKAW